MNFGFVFCAILSRQDCYGNFGLGLGSPASQHVRSEVKLQLTTRIFRRLRPDASSINCRPQLESAQEGWTNSYVYVCVWLQWF